MDEYHAAMTRLARKVLRVLALTLELEEEWFEEFAAGEEPMAVLRLLHYPPQEPSSEGVLEKGQSLFKLFIRLEEPPFSDSERAV